MSVPAKIPVPIPGHEYHILLSHGLVDHFADAIERTLPARRYALIADESVADLYGSRVVDQVSQIAPVSVLTFPPGETSKTRSTWADLTDRMHEAGIGRDGAVLALGGGVTGDLAGFVSATYLRGIPFIQIPTSLLAMIDSSVGGKTGVDTAHGKNLVGAFHQPRLVLIDTAFLSSVPDAAFFAGMAEAIKHGVIADPTYLKNIVTESDAIRSRDPDALAAVIEISVRIKAAVVAQDERESGARAILNFGHTIGHAVEACGDFAQLHGECVALGMALEAQLGEELGITAAGTRDTVVHALEQFELPIALPPIPVDEILDQMGKDKKNRADQIRFSLVEAIGSVARTTAGDWTIPVPNDVTKRFLESTR